MSMTTTISSPWRVTTCGPSVCALRMSSLRRCLASWTCHRTRLSISLDRLDIVYSSRAARAWPAAGRRARNPSCPGTEGRADLQDLLSRGPHLRQRQLDDPGRHPVRRARQVDRARRERVSPADRDRDAGGARHRLAPARGVAALAGLGDLAQEHLPRRWLQVRVLSRQAEDPLDLLVGQCRHDGLARRAAVERIGVPDPRAHLDRLAGYLLGDADPAVPDPAVQADRLTGELPDPGERAGQERDLVVPVGDQAGQLEDADPEAVRPCL